MAQTHHRDWASSLRKRGWSGLAMVSVAALLLGGCAERRAKAIPWSTAIRVRPEAPARTVASDIDSAPEFPLQAPSATAPLVPGNVMPPRPHVAALPPAEAAPSEKLNTPTIAPALSLQEVASAQQDTNQSLATAQGALARIQGRSLSATQSDMVSKIQSFIGEAQEAAKVQDWTRARSLAKKAEVLAEELRSAL